MRIAVTGGSGTLGSRLVRALRLGEDDVGAPPRTELDVTSSKAAAEWFRGFRPDLVIHCAAMIRARGADSPDDRATMSRTNVLGTGNVTAAAERVGARLVYISTDFVFAGDKPGGRYDEDEIPCPFGYYPLTKLAGERLALAHPNALAIRCSFNADWPYPGAFVDRFTSKLEAGELAREIELAAKTDLTGVLHIGGDRRSYFEFAKTLRPDVSAMTVRDIQSPDPLPIDTSLDSSRWRRERQRLLSNA